MRFSGTPGFDEIFLGKLTVSGGSGMQYAASRVRYMSFLRDEFKRFHKFGAYAYVSVYSEAHHAALTVREIFFREFMVFVAF